LKLDNKTKSQHEFVSFFLRDSHKTYVRHISLQTNKTSELVNFRRANFILVRQLKNLSSLAPK